MVQDPQAIPKCTNDMVRTLDMATTLGVEEGMTPGVEEKMSTGRMEEEEERMDTEVIEVLVGKAESTGAPEPINTIMEATITAEQGEALEESARRLQAIGSLL